jgi:hypothetical protein
MAYDASLDKELERIDLPDSNVTVTIMKYGNGAPKAMLQRRYKGRNGEGIDKLNRLTATQLRALTDNVTEIIARLNAHS